MQQAGEGAAVVNELTDALDEWQGTVLGVVDAVHPTFRLLGLGAAAQPCSMPRSCSSSNSSDIYGRVRWAYLLQLPRSKKLAAAFDVMTSAIVHFNAVLLPLVSTRDIIESNPAQAADQAACEAPGTVSEAAAAAAHSRQQAMNEAYSAALQFCRVLAGAAPLPHLCNNLGCSSLAAGGTEAAAAVKVCSGCGAWYCSAGSAAAHWRQHKKACRRMAALRLNVNA
jgi:hypothetical protein